MTIVHSRGVINTSAALVREDSTKTAIGNVKTDVSSRKVQFAPRVEYVTDDVRSTLLPASKMTQEEKDRLWYSEVDYHYFEELNSNVVVDATLQQNEAGDDSSCSSCNNYYPFAINQIYNACVTSTKLATIVTSSAMTSLQDAMRSCFLLRGLEMWSVPTVAEKRRKRKEAHVRAVLHLQSRLQSPNSLISVGNHTDKRRPASYYYYSYRGNQDKAEAIRVAAQNLSRPSVLFAQCMAHADAASLHQEWAMEDESSGKLSRKQQTSPKRQSLLERVRQTMRRRWSSPSSRRFRRKSV